jgi:hypothetical protein
MWLQVEWVHIAQALDYVEPIERVLTYNSSLAPGVSPSDYGIKVLQDADHGGTEFTLTLNRSKKLLRYSISFVFQLEPFMRPFCFLSILTCMYTFNPVDASVNPNI